MIYLCQWCVCVHIGGDSMSNAGWITWWETIEAV